MSRPIAVVLVVLFVGLSGADQAQSAASTPAEESGSPINDQGSNYNYRSDITRIAPSFPGLHLEVLEFADRLSLRNQTGKTVTIYGYQGEPYARVGADGAVEVNERSPAYYLNQNFYGEVNVPSSASPSAAPRWTLIDRTGHFEWHDHRIHYMSPALPAQVKDKSKRTKVFDWRVPIAVGSERAAVDGQLFWVPEQGTKTPVVAVIVLVAIVIAGIALVFFVRRRRRAQDHLVDGPASHAAPAPPQAASEDTAKEAW